MDELDKINLIEDEKERSKARASYWHKKWLAKRERDELDTRTEEEKLAEQNAQREWFLSHPSA